MGAVCPIPKEPIRNYRFNRSRNRRVRVANPFESDEIDYRVLVNAEGQHSLWPAFREIPAGWSAVGPTRPRQECLDWIEAHWQDMRPTSVIESANGSS
jgi:MbtH protein